MKKYRFLLAVLALVLSSLACQTLMGGGNSPTLPNIPNVSDATSVPDVTNPAPTSVPTHSGGNNGGDSQFPITSDAYNVMTAANTVTYQTKMSAEAVTKLYRDEFTAKGYTEDSSMSFTYGKTFTLGFKDGNSKTIIVAGVDAGDGSLFVTVTTE